MNKRSNDNNNNNNNNNNTASYFIDTLFNVMSLFF